MSVAPGWYRDPQNWHRERFWDGVSWNAEVRGSSMETQDFPGPVTPQEGLREQRPEGDGLYNAGVALYFLAAIVAIAGVVVGIVLFTRTGCSGDSLDCFDTTHPYTGAGAAALVGGIIQGALIAVVARLCVVVSELREAARA